MAATSVLKLQIDDREYEASLKNAKAGMQDLQQSLQAAGKTFSDVDGKVVEYARAIGQMDATSKTAKGRIGEMSQAFIELKSQYINMTDAEKQSPLGQAMAQSLEELKGRTIEAKQQLADLNKELEVNSGDAKESSGILDQLAGKFTINVDAIKLFNLGLQATKAVLDVAKDAFFNNEENLDEWGRTVESCESIYKGFLNSINTGDISGFLTNIHTITQAARDAYDALDELATFTAFNKANVAGARADLTGAIADYREGKGSKEGVSEASDKLIKELEQKQKLQKEAYSKVIAKVAAERGVSASDLMKVMTGNYGTFKELKDLQYTGNKTRVISTGGTFTSGPTFQTVNEAVPANEREKLAQVIKHLNDTEIDNFQSLAEAAKMTEVEINNQRKMVARVLNGKQGSGGGDGGKGDKGGKDVTWAADSIKAQEMLVAELRKQWNEAAGDVRNEYLSQLVDAEKKLKEMNDQQAMLRENLQGRLLLKTEDISTTGLSNVGGIGTYENAMAHVEKGFEITKPLQLDDKTIKKIQESFADGIKTANLSKEIGNITGGVGQVFGSLEQLGIELPEGLTAVVGGMQSIISILTGISTIVTAIEAITGADVLIPLAHGGIVKAAGGTIVGNSYSGDNLRGIGPRGQIYGLNAGEVVLNRSQVGNLASQLSGNNFGGANLVARLRGRDILISVERTLQSKGKGQLVTFK